MNLDLCNILCYNVNVIYFDSNFLLWKGVSYEDYNHQ